MPWIAITKTPYIEEREPLYLRYYQGSETDQLDTIPVCFEVEPKSETITLISVTDEEAVILCDWNSETWVLKPVINRHTKRPIPGHWIFSEQRQPHSIAFTNSAQIPAP